MSQQYRYSLPERRGDTRQLGQLTGSACAVECAEIIERHDGPVMLITPDMQTALRLRDEIQQFSPQSVSTLSDWETLPYDSFSPHQDIISARLSCLYHLPAMKRGVIILPINTLMQRVCPHEFLHGHALVMKKASTCHGISYAPNLSKRAIAVLNRSWSTVSLRREVRCWTYTQWGAMNHIGLIF